MSWKQWLNSPATTTNRVASSAKTIIKRGSTLVTTATSTVVSTTTNHLLGTSPKRTPSSLLSLLKDPAECPHTRVDTSSTDPVCDDCGTVLHSIIKDNNGTGESRCFHHTSNPRDISPDLKGKNIPDSIAHLAAVYYLQVIDFDEETGEGDIKRKNSRKASIAKCVGQAYNDMGIPKSQEHLAKLFGISVEELNKKGKISHTITTAMGRKSISPMNYVPEMLLKLEYLELSSSTETRVDKLWGYVKNLQGEYDFDTRRPKSMAAALIYFCVRLNLNKQGKNEKFDIVKFGKAVNVSVNTFQSIAQAIAQTVSGAEELTL